MLFAPDGLRQTWAARALLEPSVKALRESSGRQLCPTAAPAAVSSVMVSLCRGDLTVLLQSRAMLRHLVLILAAIATAAAQNNPEADIRAARERSNRAIAA